MQTIAKAYSDPTKKMAFIEKMKTRLLEIRGGREIFEINEIYVDHSNAGIDRVEDDEGGGENDGSELKRYNELHRKRTKLRQNVKKMIQKMNPGTTMDNVVLFGTQEDI
jgi:hypothetical protein